MDLDTRKRSSRARFVHLALLLVVVASVARAGVVSGVLVPGGSDPVSRPGPPAAHQAAEVVIDFDGGSAPCAFMETLPLRDTYLASGVRFAGPDPDGGGAILNACGNFDVTGYSGTNFLAFNPLAHCLNGGVPKLPESILFTSPVSAVSMLVGAGFGASETVTLNAYNALDVLVDSNSRVPPRALQPLGVTGPGIVRVVLSGGITMVVDDLRFTPGGVVSVASRSWGQLKSIYR